ncbi:MAG: M16 family metallopeptidase [Vibrio sp.]
MKKLFLRSCLCVCMGVALPSFADTPAVAASELPQGVRFIEASSQPADGKVSIPYKKYQLENGLTLILSPDHSDPLVHVDVTYHVGSAREQIGRSGFAHFFEHMMFQGSEHVGDQQHFKIITQAGGTLNGSTTRDRTNYYETVPANQLEKVLWLESDRMGYLVNAISQRKFEIQRDTVKNERGQNYDNRPYGLVYERIGEALYPKNHPYSWQTIGYVSDLDRVDVNDLKDFFLRWYGPNNAVLTIGGDIDEAQTLAWVNKYFGQIPRGPEVKDAPKQPTKLDKDRFITLEDQVRQPMLMMAYPTQYQGADDEVTLDTLASLLGSGKNSILYQSLVKTGKAVDAGAYQDCAELACTLYVYAMTDSGEKGDLTPIYQDIQTALADFSKKGVSQDQLDQVVGKAKANAVYALQSVAGKVTQLAQNETFYKQPDRLQTELDKLQAVTPESVMDAFNSYVADKPKVALSVVPKGQTQLAAKASNFTPPERDLPKYDKITEKDLAIREPTEDFDRNQMPKVAKAVETKVPDIYRFSYDNGIDLLGTVTTETPTVDLILSLPAGARYVPKGKEGLADLTAAMMDEGTKKRSSEALQQALDKLGSRVSFSASQYSTKMGISSLTENLDQTLSLAQEILFEPAFNQADFDRIKKQMIEGLIYSHQTPAWLASQATREVIFKNTAFEQDPEGSIASLKALTLDDVKNFYHTYYTPQHASLVAVGDIKQADLKEKTQFLAKWQGDAVKPIALGEPKPVEKQSIYLVDKPNAPQSTVRFVRLGLPYDATGEMYLGQLANYNLAGNFNSRINQNLREDKGFTYGASGGFSGGKELGSVLFSAEVRADSTVQSIQEIQKELANYVEKGVTESELGFMRLAIGQQDALKYETAGDKASLLLKLHDFQLDDDYMEQRQAILSQVTKQKLDQISKKWFQPSDYQIIVVGDAKTLAPQLEKLNIPVKMLEVKP